MRRNARAVVLATTHPVVSLRVARWAWSARRRLERSLRTDGIDALDRLEPPPAVAARHRSAVSAVLRLTGATCLVRSAVLQHWDAAHGRPRPLVVGVARQPDGTIAAHAWLDGEPSANGFIELHRHPPA